MTTADLAVKPQLNATGQASSASSSHDEEKMSPPIHQNFGEAPDGGRRAWLVTIGAACSIFSALGLANSFGVFEEYYLTHQLHDKTPDDVAWIGSLSAFLQFAAGAVAGPLFDRHGAKIIRPAALLMVFAVMMLSLCKEYWQFMLVQGVLIGLVQGFLQFPALAAVSQYFNKKRAAALGVAISGSSIGGVVLPIALSKMLNDSSLGFGWSVRIVGFVLAPLLAFACVTITTRVPPKQSSLIKSSAFREARYVLLIAALFFMLIGLFAPLFFIPTYAVTRGVDPTLASYLLAIINATSTFGRIIPGMLADKFGRLNVFAIGGAVTGIILICLNKAETTPALIVYSIFFGFTSGTIISGASAAFSQIPKDPRDFGTYMGMGMGISSVAVLIGPPIEGALISKYGGFLQLSIFSGVMCLVGSCLAILCKAANPQGIWGRV